MNFSYQSFYGERFRLGGGHRVESLIILGSLMYLGGEAR